MKRHTIQLTRSKGEKLCASACFVPKTPKKHIRASLEHLLRVYHPEKEGDILEIVSDQLV
jgi:hypothetical protein